MHLTDAIIYGNSTLSWLIALGIAIGSTAVLAIARVTVLKVLQPSTTERAFTLNVVRHTRYTFFAIISIAVASTYLALSARTQHVLAVVATVATLLQIAWWGHGLTRFWVQRVIKRRLEEDIGSVTVIRTLGTIIIVALWIVILVSIIATLGRDVTGLVAGLGISGIAIALAVQNIVGDLFASISIMVDKPFVVGDFIQVGTMLGTVEQIGLKSTRLASLSGEQLIFGNGDLLKSRIQNYKRMVNRRIVFTIGAEYGTPTELVQAIPAMMKSAITAQAPVRFDRAHFKEYGDSALTYEAVYYVLSPDYNTYMDIQQAINFILYSDFEKAGIGMAFPTRTVMLHLTPDDSTALAAIAKAQAQNSNGTEEKAANPSARGEGDTTVGTK